MLILVTQGDQTPESRQQALLARPEGIALVSPTRSVFTTLLLGGLAGFVLGPWYVVLAAGIG